MNRKSVAVIGTTLHPDISRGWEFEVVEQAEVAAKADYNLKLGRRVIVFDAYEVSNDQTAEDVGTN